MAIQKPTTLEHFGLVLENAYHKIDDISLSNKHVRFSVKTYASKEARDALASPINTVINAITFDDLQAYEGDDIIAKLYTFTKTVNPEFATDTTDV